jgi:hypothetical protein
MKEIRWNNLTLREAVELLKRSDYGWFDGDRKAVVVLS